MLEIKFLNELIGSENELIKIIDAKDENDFFYFLVENKKENNNPVKLLLDKKLGMFGTHELIDEVNRRKTDLSSNYFEEDISYFLKGLQNIFEYFTEY